MRLRCAILCGCLLAVTAAFGQATDSTVYVKQFPGVDVGTKVANAMASCPADTRVPCILVIDPSLAVSPAGVLPTMCSSCHLEDFRYGIPSVAAASCDGAGPVNVEVCYGAKPDFLIVTSGAITAGTKTLSMSDGLFAQTDVGKLVYVVGAGSAGGLLLSSVTGYVDSNHVLIKDAAGTSVGGVILGWGTDNTPMVQAALNTAGGIVLQPHLAYGNDVLRIYFPHGNYLFGSRLYVPDSDFSHNRNYAFEGDGPGISELYKYNPAEPLFDVRALGYPYYTYTWRDLAIDGIPSLPVALNGDGILGDTSGGWVVRNCWFNAVNYPVHLMPDGVGNGTSDIQLYDNTAEYVGSFLKIENSTTGNWDVTIRGGQIGPAGYGGAYAVDLNNTSGIIISDLRFINGLVNGIKCTNCTNLDIHDVDFSDGVHASSDGTLTGYTNLLLTNSSGKVHHNNFASSRSPAVSIAGGDTLDFDHNTFNGSGSQQYMAVTGAASVLHVKNEKITNSVTGAISITNTAVSKSIFSENYFDATISNPVYVSGAVDSASHIAGASEQPAVLGVQTDCLSAGNCNLGSSATKFGSGYFGGVMDAGSFSSSGVAGYTGSKTAGTCVLTISHGIITNVTGC